MAIGVESTTPPAPVTRGKRVARAPRSAALPLAPALAALALAVAAAILPAIPRRATYVWPPTALSGHPVRSWFAPLLAERGTAENVSAAVPCRPGPVLPAAGPNPVLLGTARDARLFHALQARWLGSKQQLVVRVGSTTLARIPAPKSAACTVSIRIAGRRWSIRQSTGVRASGLLPAGVGLTGLVTQLDLRARPALRVTVAPTIEDTRASATQTVLRVLALIGLVAALVLVVRRDPRRHRPSLRSLFPSPGLPDAFVGLTLVTWWIVGPVYYDDGWVAARQTNSLLSGAFSTYFDHHAANLPLGWWLEWLQRLVVGHTRELLWQRLPTIVCLAALWVVARATLATLVGRPSKRGDAIWWSAATVFGVGAAAFGVTLRPEPMNALLTAAVLLCMVKFARRPSRTPLAVAAILAGLAITEHPEGIVAFAPVIACLPRIVREVRSRTIEMWSVAAVSVAGAAWIALLEFLGSDLQHRLTDERLLNTGYETHGVTGEWLRYAWLSSDASPLRRELVALCILCVLALLVRRARRAGTGTLLPAGSVALGLALLAFVPSKWVFHFGTLVGICAVAVGVEVDRWRQRRRLHASSVKAGLAATALLLVSGWAAISPAAWGPLDLRTIAPRQIPFALIGLLLGLWGAGALILTMAASLRRGRRGDGEAWRTLSLGFPLLLVTLLALSTGGFVADALATRGSTPPRQNVDTLIGKPSCGLAGDIGVPDLRAVVAAPPLGTSVLSAAASPRVPVSGLQTVRPGTGVSRSTVWYEPPRPGHALGIYVGGVWRRSDSLTVTWGRSTRHHITPVATGTVRLAGSVTRELDKAQWTFVPQSALPIRPHGASAVSVRLAGRKGSLALATSPVWYSSVRLATWVQRRGTLTLVSPFGLEYVSCARLPAIEWGVAQWPSLVVDWGDGHSATEATGPFAGIADLFTVTRLPLEARPELPPNVTAYAVEVDTRDALAPAVRERSS